MAMRNGNFSEILGTTPINDPSTGVLLNSTCKPGSTGTTVCCTPFAGNIIPQNRIYAPAQAFLNLFPEPNQPELVNNYLTDQNLLCPYRSYLVKIDHNFNSNNRVSGKY